jgi:hypothetical protein
MLLRTALRSVAATSLLAALVVALAPTAGAAAAHATGVTAPTTATVGQILPITIDITNTSTAPESASGHTISDIRVVPSCGSPGPNAHGDCAQPDVGAMTVTGPVIGVDGTACAGVIFAAGPDPGSTSGRLRLTPSATVELDAPGPSEADVCRIRLGLRIERTPAIDALPAGNRQSVMLASSVGTSNIAAPGEPNSTSFSAGAAAITITPATPSLVTQVPDADVAAGEDVADTATLSGGADPTGSLTFDLFGPDDDDCSGPPVASSTHPVAGAGTYASSAATPTDPGAYRFVARYSGDADNAPVSGSCNDPNEAVAVTAAEPPGIRVLKTATPLSRPEPGGTFSFHVAVTNTSAVPLTLTGMSDDVHGDVATQGTCTDAVGTDLGPGDSYVCDFPGDLRGNAGTTQTDVVTVTAVDAAGGSVADDDDAVVSLTDVPPSVQVAKDALPDVRVAPGGVVTFGVRITSTSVEPVTITALTDDVYGDLTELTGSSCAQVVGTSLEPGATVSCTFEGRFTGVAGAAQTDVVTVTVADDEGSTGTAQDDATVRLVAPGTVTSTTSTTSTTSAASSSSTSVSPTSSTLPPTPPVATARPPRLAATGSEPRRSGLLAGALVGVGLLCLGLGSVTDRRRRT